MNAIYIKPTYIISRIKYIYTLESSYKYESNLLNGISFKNEWVNVNNSTITISDKYSWDGCSPKYKLKIFNKYLIIGTPDGDINSTTGYPKAYYASLLHDSLYQFCKDIALANNCSFRHIKDISDKIFYNVLVRDGFECALLYYNAVKHFGLRWIK